MLRIAHTRKGCRTDPFVRGFIYAGHTSHADSCLVLMVGFWRCSSLLLHGAIKYLRMLNGAFFFFVLKKILLTFSASSCVALMTSQVSSVLSVQMSVRGTTIPY